MDNFLKTDDFKVVIPKRRQDRRICLKKNGAMSSWGYVPTNFSMVINVKNKNNNVVARNRIRIGSKEATNILSSGAYIEYDSSSMLDSVLKIGRKINQRLRLNHFQKTMKKYSDKIIDSRIEKQLERFCNKYDYVPFGKEDNYLDFIIFIYRTWELCLISLIFETSKSSDMAFNFMKRYYHHWYDYTNSVLSYLDDYLEEYKKYDIARFNLVFSQEQDDSFSMVIFTEELILPIIFETKNCLCYINKHKKLSLCKVCGRLYRVKNGKQVCSKKCDNERDRAYQRKK